jgi:hypothetical protein
MKFSFDFFLTTQMSEREDGVANDDLRDDIFLPSPTGVYCCLCKLKRGSLLDDDDDDGRRLRNKEESSCSWSGCQSRLIRLN